MTIQEFLLSLKANRNRFDWVLQAHAGHRPERRAKSRLRIRGIPKEGGTPAMALDPIRAVCYVQTGKTFDSDAWSDVADTLKIDRTAADVLLSAANDHTWFWSEALRRRTPAEYLLAIRRQLIEAVGLPAETTQTE